MMVMITVTIVVVAVVVAILMMGGQFFNSYDIMSTNSLDRPPQQLLCQTITVTEVVEGLGEGAPVVEGVTGQWVGTVVLQAKVVRKLEMAAKYMLEIWPGRLTGNN